MPTPSQRLESKQCGRFRYMWTSGQGLPLEKPGLKLGPRDNLFDAQIDEHIAKGLLAQKLLVALCREMTSVITGAVVTDPGIKKRPTIVEKIKKRGKSVEAVNDVSRATVTFSHLVELYAADAWVQERPEFKKIASIGGTARKNRYTKLDSDGDYRDIKSFLAFTVKYSPYPWVTELQLNLKVAQKNKGIGHGIYEITRLGDAIPMGQSLPIPSDKVMRIAKKLRPCYVALKKTGINPQLLEQFRVFIYKYFDDAIKNLEKSNYVPTAFSITPNDRQMLNLVSQAVYKYSFKVAKNASSYKQGGLKKLIGPDELLTK